MAEGLVPRGEHAEESGGATQSSTGLEPTASLETNLCEAWLDEQVSLVWHEVQREAVGSSGEMLERSRSIFQGAEADARRQHEERRHRAQPGPPLTSAQIQQRFKTEIEYLYRSRFALSVHADFDSTCLMPDKCRNERVRSLFRDEQLSELRNRRFLVIDWALRPKEVFAARAEADALDEAGQLKPQPTFSGYNARDDRAMWIGDDIGGALASALRLLQGVAAVLQAADVFEPLCVPPRGMLALYPGGGARYTKHRDSMGDDPRRVTCILYLQTLAWRSDVDGGELSVLPPGEFRPHRIAPMSGRLVVFDSRAVEHEVLPARGNRMALSLWLRRAPLDGNADRVHLEGVSDDGQRAVPGEV